MPIIQHQSNFRAVSIYGSTIKGQEQDLGDTLVKGATSALVSGTFSAIAQGVTASNSMRTVNTVPSTSSPDVSVRNPSISISSSKWTEGFGAAFENFGPATVDTVKAIRDNVQEEKTNEEQ